MSEINAGDEALLNALKKEVEKKAGLQNAENWTQKDYDFLVFYIEENSGVKISLTTLKRIWRNEYSRLPHISTLDALSYIAYSKDWLSLKLENTKTQSIPEQTPKINPTRKVSYRWIPISIALIAISLFFVFSNRIFRKNTGNADVIFAAKTSVENKVPNSVIFTYDVHSVDADKFYIQQSWDPRRRVEVSKNNHQQTDIYYLPGYYMAKLFADDSIIKEIPVHIVTDDWVIAAHQKKIENKVIPKTDWVKNGGIGADKALLSRHKIDINEPFKLTFHDSHDFKTDGNQFSFSSSFKLDSSASTVCPVAAIVIKGENEYIYLNVGKKGCESELKMKVSDKRFDGKKMDLTAFGTDIYNWQNINVSAKNNKVEITLKDKKVFTAPYSKSIGPLKEVVFIFDGSGVVDKVKLK
ncbi:hypothetical protein [Runella sp.]|uniref:hypothetical protein n=1 Tax=Runella sp. TaxID=1960881 RepID=UPI003D0D4C93